MGEYRLIEDINQTLENGGTELKTPFLNELEEKYSGDDYSVKISFRADKDYKDLPYCKIFVNDGTGGNVYSEVEFFKLYGQEAPVAELLSETAEMAAEAEDIIKNAKKAKPR